MLVTLLDVGTIKLVKYREQLQLYHRFGLHTVLAAVGGDQVRSQVPGSI